MAEKLSDPETAPAPREAGEDRPPASAGQGFSTPGAGEPGPGPRQTLTGWKEGPRGTPTVLLHLDLTALQDLNSGGAVLLLAPRDAAGSPQLIALLAPHADATTQRRLQKALKTAAAELKPLAPLGRKR